MRMLTVHQPWGWAIMIGGKDVENRSWPTNYRGPLAIHTSQTYDATCPRSNVLMETILRFGIGQPAELWPKNSPQGHVLGVVDLVDCRRDSNSPWAEPGAWHLVLANPRRLPNPIARSGRQKLWTPDPKLARALSELEATS